jgi:O-antigen/teichoic acid export membrane protein
MWIAALVDNEPLMTRSETIQGGSSEIKEILAKGALLAFISRIAGVFTLLLTELILARLLGLAAFGDYIYVLSIINVLMIISKCGMDTAAVRYIPQYTALGQWGALAWFLNRSRLLVITVSVAFAAGLGALVCFLPRYLRADPATFLWALPLLPALCLMMLYGGYFQALARIFISRAPYDILYPLLIMAGALFLFVGNLAAPSGANAMAVTLVSAVAVTAVLMILFSTTVPTRSPVEKPEGGLREIIGVGTQVMLVDGFSIFLARIDIILLGAILGTDSAGIYAAVTRLSSGLLLGLISVNTIVRPLVAKLYYEKRIDDLKLLIARSTRMIFLITAAFSILAVIFGELVLKLYGPGFAPGYGALLILVLGNLFYSAAGSVIALMIMAGYQRDVAWIFACSIVFNVVSNLAVIPLLGINGAAITTMLTTGLWTTALVVQVHRKLGIDSTIFSSAVSGHGDRNQV